MTNAIDVSSLIVGILGGGVGVEIVRQCFALLNPKPTAAQAIEAQLRIHAVLDELVSTTQAHSVVMVETQNGAALSRPGQVMYVTVTSEACSDRATPTQSRWLGVAVDPGYHLALRQLLGDPSGIIHYKTPDWPSQAIRDMYHAMGVKGSWIVSVESTPNIMRYIVIRMDSTCQDVDKDVLRTAASEIGTIIRG